MEHRAPCDRSPGHHLAVVGGMVVAQDPVITIAFAAPSLALAMISNHLDGRTLLMGDKRDRQRKADPHLPKTGSRSSN